MVWGLGLNSLGNVNFRELLGVLELAAQRGQLLLQFVDLQFGVWGLGFGPRYT